MDSEIDLRVYLRILRTGWGYIVAGAALFAIAAFILTSFVLPKAYTVSTLIYLFPPSFQFSLEQSLNPVSPDESVLRTLTRLVVSDAVVAETIERVRPVIAAERADGLRLERVRETVLVPQILDNRVLSLSVTWGDPDEAVAFASAWAQSFSEAANRLLTSQDAQRITSIIAQREQVEVDYQTARLDLETFQTETGTAPLQRELNVMRDQYEGLFRQLDQIDLLLLDVSTLRAVFGAFPAEARPTTGDMLALFNLQNRLLVIRGQVATPLLQVDASLTADQTYASLLGQLSAYETALREQQTVLTDRIAPLLAQLHTLEGEYQAALNREQELRAYLDRAREAYITLVNAEESLAVYSGSFNELVRVGAEAIVPTEPSQPRVMFTTVLAAAVGAILGFILIFTRAYLRAAPADVPSAATSASMAANRRS